MGQLKYLFLALWLAMLTCTGGGSAYADASDLNRINVTAEASMEVTPDVAYVEFNVIGRGKDADAAVQESATKMEAVRRALLGSNIYGDDLITTRYNLAPYYNDKGKVAGYNANNSIQVKIKDTAKIGGVIDKISGAGAERISNISYDISNRELYRQTLLAQAVSNAKAQAAVVANAGGRTLGNLLCATISQYGNNARIYGNVMLKAAAATDEPPATEISVKNITLKANVDVSFSLQ